MSVEVVAMLLAYITEDYHECKSKCINNNITVEVKYEDHNKVFCSSGYILGMKWAEFKAKIII